MSKGSQEEVIRPLQAEKVNVLQDRGRIFNWGVLCTT